MTPKDSTIFVQECKKEPFVFEKTNFKSKNRLQTSSEEQTHMYESIIHQNDK